MSAPQSQEDELREYGIPPGTITEDTFRRVQALLALHDAQKKAELLAKVPNPMPIREPEARGYNLGIRHCRDAIEAVYGNGKDKK